MKNLPERKNKGSTEEARRLLRFMTLPLIAIILMIVIVVLDKPKGGKENSSETVAEETSAVGETDVTQGESQTAETKEPVITLEEAAPEIHNLMEAYFKARRTCDIEAFSEVYGGTCGQELLHDQRIKMEEEVKFYQGFHNLVCYTVPGLYDGDYVIYAKYDIKFRQADTLAPSMIAVYAGTAGDGSIYLTASTSEEQLAYLTKVNQSEPVQSLAAEVNHLLSEALKVDENLLSVYRTLVVEADESNEAGESQESSTAPSESQENETNQLEDGQDEREDTPEPEE